jgi:ABC-type phosphate transport system permease subunit
MIEASTASPTGWSGRRYAAMRRRAIDQITAPQKPMIQTKCRKPGSWPRNPKNRFGGTNTTHSQEICRNAQTPFPAAQDRAWSAALTLIIIVFVCTVIARIVSNRFAVRR